MTRTLNVYFMAIYLTRGWLRGRRGSALGVGWDRVMAGVVRRAGKLALRSAAVDRLRVPGDGTPDRSPDLCGPVSNRERFPNSGRAGLFGRSAAASTRLPSGPFHPPLAWCGGAAVRSGTRSAAAGRALEPDET